MIDVPLKPCPFCGGAPKLKDCRTAWMVECECGAGVLGERAPEPEGEMPDAYWARFEQSAIDAWNRRDEPPPQHTINGKPAAGPDDMKFRSEQG